MPSWLNSTPISLPCYKYNAYSLLFLGDLGGQLGLFIGVSVLTICEMLETLLMACYKCYGQRRKNRVDDKWADTVQQIQVQSVYGNVNKGDYVVSIDY